MSLEKSITILAIGLLAVSVVTKGFSEFSFSNQSNDTEKIKQKAQQFITEQLMRGQEDSFEIKNIEKEKGLYKLTVDVQGREIVSYMTEDVSTFFPSALDMNPEVAGAETEQQPQEIPATDNPKAQLFVMSYCPYGNQAENLIKPVVDLLGDKIELEPHYIFYENYNGGGPDFCLDEESKYCSMHGVNEANQNIRELCVYQDQKDKFWDYLMETNQKCTVDNIETCWEDTAQNTGVNTAQVKDCFQNKKLALAEQEQKLTKDLEISGSPALVINDVKYTGSRSSEAYKQAICSAFNEEPQACGQSLESDSQAVEGSCE